jgi:hypothetical protein
LKKSRSLGRDYNHCKREINNRIIPLDILLDAKPNIQYLESQIPIKDYSHHNLVSKIVGDDSEISTVEKEI